MQRQFLALLFISLSTSLNAQLLPIEQPAQDSTARQVLPASLKLSGFVETYFGYDFCQPLNNARPEFVYSHNRHNEVSINLAFLRANYESERTRACLAIAAGTYMNANYASEPGLLKNLYEAYIGFKVSKNSRLWIDAGIMPSHIGFESAHSPSCWTLTRSILADNSPYFESGVKLGYTLQDGKLYIAGLVLNGWQRIQRMDGNSSFCAGTQLTYMPSEKLSVNYSTFLGNDKPDSLRRSRIFHNLYGIIQLSGKLGVIAGFDYGMEQRFTGSSAWNNWIGAAVIIQYKATSKFAIAIRGEYFNDENGVIIAMAGNGIKASGFSANFDCQISRNLLWRIEGKFIRNEDDIFKGRNAAPGNTNTVATTSLAITF